MILKSDLKNVRAIFVFLLLVFLGICAYSGAIHNPFVHDDVVFIRNNPHIADLKHLPFVFLNRSFGGPEVPQVNPYYRPMLEVVYRLQYRMFGFNPSLYHLFNVILHILNAFLVYVLIARLTSRKEISFCASVLFLLHPVQSQAVASVAGISNLMFAFFCFLSFYFYLLSREESNRLKLSTGIVAVFFFFVALLAKEQAVILPVLIILADVLLLRRRKFFELDKIVTWVMFLAAIASYMAIRRMVSGDVWGSLFAHKGELWLRILAMPRILLMYLGLIFWPHDLHYYRSINVLEPAGFSLFLFLALLGLIVYGIARAPREERGTLIFFVSWFFISIAPTINFFPLIIEYSLVSAAEHFLYLPLAGVLVVIIVLADRFLRKYKERGGRIAQTGMILISLVFILVINRQNTYWRAEIPLFERAVRYEKNIGRLHTLLGRAYYFNEEYDRAILSLKRALEIMEGYVAKVGEGEAREFYLGFVKGIYFDLAHCYEAKNEPAGSIKYYQKILSIDPQDSVVYNNLGTNLLGFGQRELAFECFQKAFQFDPDNVMALNNMAVYYIQTGQEQKAESFLRRALKLDKNFGLAAANLERLLSQQKKEAAE